MQLDNLLREEYSRLYSLGYIVYPYTKALTKKGEAQKYIHKWSERVRMPPEDIKNVWSYSVGLAIFCGPETGIMAIDVDIINPDKAKAAIDFIQSVAPTKYGKFGSKGLTLFYQLPDFITGKKRIEPKGNKIQGEYDTCVDILVNSLCNVPPSIHVKSGKNYVYPEGYLPLPAVNELPKLTVDQYRVIIEKLERDAENESTSLKKALKESGSTRFYQIQQKAMDLCRNHLDKSNPELAQELIKYDLEQKFAKGSYFSDPEHQSAEKFIAGCKNEVIAQLAKDNTSFEKVKELLKERREKLPEPTGYIKKIYDILKITANSSRDHNLRYLTSMFIFSNLIIRNISIKHGSSQLIDPSIFVFILGDTSCGKSVIIDEMQSFFDSLNSDSFPAKNKIGADEISYKNIGVSLARVYEDLDPKTTNIFIEDEAKSFIERLEKKTTASVDISFSSFFTKIFGAKRTITNPSRSNTSKKNNVEDVKEDCAVSLYAATTKKSFLNAASQDILENGFLNRCLVLDVETDTELRSFNDEILSDHDKILKYWNILADIIRERPEQRQLTLTDKTHPDIMDFYSKKEQEGRIAVLKENEIMARKVVIICKLALILKASDDLQFKDISIDYYERAEHIYNIIQKSFDSLLSDFKSGSRHEMIKRQIVKSIHVIGDGNYVPVSLVSVRGSQFGSTKLVLLKELEREGMIEIKEKTKENPMTVRVNYISALNAKYF